MTDTVDGLIAEIHAELNTLSGGTIPYSVDERVVVEHSSPPRIVWVDAPSDVDASVWIGGNDGAIATDKARFEVHIWQVDRENARNTFHNLLRAARNTAYGPNLVVRSYRWQSQSYSKFGRVLLVELELAIPVSNEALPTAVVNTHGHTVSVDGEVIC